MVEEDAAEGVSHKSAKKQNEKPKSSPLAHTTNEGEDLSNEEEDDDEEEEEKYDIDDSSPEAAAATASTSTATIKTNSPPPIAPAAVAARAINKDGIVESHFTHKSGYDSPDRYRDAQPHPPKVHFRHMIDGVDPSAYPSSSGSGSTGMGESVKTPRPGDRNEVHPGAAAASDSDHSGAHEDGRPHSAGVQQHHHHSPHYPHNHHHHKDHSKPSTAPPDRRAFAVWGQDESDSNTSDGEL